MALKILLLRKQLESLMAKQKEKEEEVRSLLEKEKTLEEAIEEIDETTTDEERATVNEEVEALVAELEAKQKEKDELDAEITEIEGKIAELEADDEEKTSEEEEVTETERSKNKEIKLRGGENMNLQTRERIKAMLQAEETRNFFGDLRNVFEKRGVATPAITNGELLIPEEVFVEITQRAENYGALLNLVDVYKLKGQARIVILDGAVKFQWLECCDPTQETTLATVKQIELDCFKYGGHVFVCEAFVEDAELNFADFVMNLFAEAWAKGIDQVIVAGTGATAKEPEGINMHVTEVTDVKSLEELLINMGGIKKGKGEKSIVMTEDTYASQILPKTLGRDSNGNIVYGLGQTLPNGVKVILVGEDVIPAGEMIAGYFKEYKLGIRKEMTFDTNDRVKWVEGQIGYKLWGRVDGKPTDKAYFKRFKLVEGAAVEPTV